MNTFRSAACILLALGAISAPAQETERILRFHADIVVERNAALDVTETITVYAAGDQIKRGIYRDVPFRGLMPEHVLIEGRPSAYHTEPYGDGTRIYIGDAGRTLSRGTYTYSIRYRVPHEVRFFDDHDQVYWNVTGNRWAFPIEEASASVVLPMALEERHVIIEGWTGPERSTATDFEAHMPQPGEVRYVTTARLRENAGLTIRVSFSKGVVHQPTPADLAGTYLRQLGFTGLEAAALALITLYLFIAWAVFGKDPAPGRVLPTEDPPHGYSPAVCRYIRRMGYDQTALTAALVSMATKGYIRIEQDNDGDFVIVRDAASDSVLSEDERALADALLKGRSELIFTKGNRSTISAGIDAFRKALSRRNEKEYFKTNSVLLLPSFLAGVASLFAMALTGNVSELPPTLFLCVWLSIWSMVVVFLATGAVRAWADLIRQPSPGALTGAIAASLFFGIFALFEGFALWALTSVSSVGFAVTLVTIAILHAVFYQLLKAPTSRGRRFLDELDGFEMYLNGEDLARFAGQDTAARFERYLPYAIALGREVDWTRKFEDAAESALTHDRAYRPTWYQSTTQTGAPAAWVAGLNTALTSAVASATASSSSSGGGGGSSGGGGGGGGGGGW